MTSNLYKVGDWVYCETAANQPYVIRKIEELTKTPCGNVEAKVICAFRRQDIPPNILNTIDKYQLKSKAELDAIKEEKEKATVTASITGDAKIEPKSEEKETIPGATANVNGNALRSGGVNAGDFEETDVAELNDIQRYNVKHREVYFSKYTDTIAATTIRAKCSVLLFNEEVERYAEYLTRDDSFFYHLTYDPYQKSIVADKGEIRVGSKFQAEVPALKFLNGEALPDVLADDSEREEREGRVLRSRFPTNANELPEEPLYKRDVLEIMEWSPNDGKDYFGFTNPLSDEQIDKFLTVARSVGTFGRALDCNNAFKQPSLPLSAAAASRDITLFHAMRVLHENQYDVGKAALSLITAGGPVICKDELENWSAAEANLFSDGLEKYGKDFHEIQKDYLPWKCYKSIIEYYYAWKTTDRYVQQQRVKAAEKESKLKQVYIPNHSKQNQSALIKAYHQQLFTQYDVHLRSCESCGTPQSATGQWYIYNPSGLASLIMSGNQNPAALTAAAAAAHASSQTNGHYTPANNGLYQSRICADCWSYWKKFASFKFPNARQERLNQLKNQVHKCSVNGCGREFKLKQLLVKHCGVAHGYFAKVNHPPPGPNAPRQPIMRNRTSFYLLTTPMSQAARLVCVATIKLKKLGRKPFKLVELSDLNKEWTKTTRNITELLNEAKKRVYTKSKLDVATIATIFKTRVRTLKRKKHADNQLANGQNGATATNGTDAHSEEDEDEEEELIIDADTDVKPEFLRYFEKKCETPCYEPAQFLYPKPDKETMDKFHVSLMSQNRKRAHEASAGLVNGKLSGSGSGSGSGNENEMSASESSPTAKRVAKSEVDNVPVKQARVPPKSMKPTRVLNAPEDIFYICNRHLKSLRQEIEKVSIKKLARRPQRLLDEQFRPLYKTFDDIRDESKAKIAAKDAELKKSQEAVEPKPTNGTDKASKENGDAADATTPNNGTNGTNGTNGKHDVSIEELPMETSEAKENGVHEAIEVKKLAKVAIEAEKIGDVSVVEIE